MKETILIFVTLIIFFGCEKEQEEKEIAIPAKACFEFNSAVSDNPFGNNYIGDEFTFTNCSEDASSYLWDFGTGDTTSVSAPKYTFIEAKGYLVSLKAKGEANDSIAKLINIREYPSRFNIDFNAHRDYHIARGISEYYGITDVGSYTHDLTFISDNIATVEDNGIIIMALGSGELLGFEMFSSTPDGLSDGTYSFSDELSVGTFSGGIVYINANFETDTFDEEYEINNGTITIKNVGNLIMAEINCTTTEGNTVNGSLRVYLRKYDNSASGKKSITKSIWKI